MTYLLINEIPDIVNLNKKTYKICHTQTLYGSLSTTLSEYSTRVEEAIKMISTGDTWVLAVMSLGHGTGGYSFSIFGKNDNIYICDSHSQNKYGLPAMNGTSVCSRIEDKCTRK